ncbi:MAG: hypothetical protein R3194_11555 [Limnobacter sp.]|nr:hypothetical protein [Limnobacter sp.]
MLRFKPFVLPHQHHSAALVFDSFYCWLFTGPMAQLSPWLALRRESHNDPELLQLLSEASRSGGCSTWLISQFNLPQASPWQLNPRQQTLYDGVFRGQIKVIKMVSDWQLEQKLSDPQSHCWLVAPG